MPGPASYGTGGADPTFTDAALVRGFLGAETPLGGTLALDESLARAALQPLAERLSMTVGHLAEGIVRISTVKITGAVRSITVELGHDPRDFALLAFGGAGGLVAADVARELGIRRVIIPPGQGAFSALGMLMADIQYDTSRTAVMPLADVDVGVIDRFCDEMAADARRALAEQGFESSRQALSFGVDVRYTGQEHSVTVPLPRPIDAPKERLGRHFEELHERHYGHTMTDPVEVTTFRLNAVGLVDKPEMPRMPPGRGGSPAPIGHRVAGVEGRSDPVPIYRREDLEAGAVIDGPAVVAEHTATTVVHGGDRLSVGRLGELAIEVGPS